MTTFIYENKEGVKKRFIKLVIDLLKENPKYSISLSIENITNEIMEGDIFSAEIFLEVF